MKETHNKQSWGMRGLISSPRQTATSNPRPLALALEPETTMKTKLISAWNTVKYGKNGWTSAGDIFRQGFSKNSPVWLLGLAYHRKLVVGPHDSESGSPVGNKVTTFAETDSGIEAFEAEYKSKLWMSYRRNFEEVPGTSIISDCGWGCVLGWAGGPEIGLARQQPLTSWQEQLD